MKNGLILVVVSFLLTACKEHPTFKVTGRVIWQEPSVAQIEAGEKRFIKKLEPFAAQVSELQQSSKTPEDKALLAEVLPKADEVSKLASAGLSYGLLANITEREVLEICVGFEGISADDLLVNVQQVTYIEPTCQPLTNIAEDGTFSSNLSVDFVAVRNAHAGWISKIDTVKVRIGFKNKNKGHGNHTLNIYSDAKPFELSLASENPLEDKANLETLGTEPWIPIEFGDAVFYDQKTSELPRKPAPEVSTYQPGSKIK